MTTSLDSPINSASSRRRARTNIAQSYSEAGAVVRLTLPAYAMPYDVDIAIKLALGASPSRKCREARNVCVSRGLLFSGHTIQHAPGIDERLC